MTHEKTKESHLVLKQLFFLQTFTQMLYAAFIYKFIVKQRRTSSAYLLGFGLVIPSVLSMPYPVLEYFLIQNKTLKLSMGTMPLIVSFRCIEAMFDTSPHSVEENLWNYVTYYTSLSHFEWDPKTKTRRRCTAADFGAILWRLLCHFHLAGLMLSVAMHFNYQLLPTNVNLHEYNLTWELFSPAHLVNAYMLAVLAFFMLAVGFEMASFGDNLKGFLTKQPFYNPLFTSRSPSEFWGRKWNMTIHRLLKHGAYMPARQYFSMHMSYFVTFLASGLLHDYSWTVMYYQYGQPLAYHPAFFKTTAFFLWNYILMAIEHETQHMWGFTKRLPTVLVSSLVVLTALPFSHWYTGDWAASNYFAEYAMGLWFIRKVA